jgi:hypothetical protein
VCRTSNLEIAWGYAKQVEIVRDDHSSPRQRLGLSSRFGDGATVGKSEPDGLIQIAFHARDVNLVMGPRAKQPVIDLSREVIGDAT